MPQLLDKFYTIPSVALSCINYFHSTMDTFDLIVEPSAGNGRFFHQLPNDSRKVGIDIQPEHPDIIQQDFFTYFPSKGSSILVIGNPPFGKNSSMAVKFFNHASTFATTIAMIVPKTFRKTRIQNRISMNFHIAHDQDIPSNPCSFYPAMQVKCCFQVWEKKSFPREPVELPVEHSDWVFLKLGPLDQNNQPTIPLDHVDFAIRAYGGKCGEIVEDVKNLRPKSWHWIQSKIPKNELIRRFKSLNYQLSENTARQNSIGKAELVQLYSESI